MLLSAFRCCGFTTFHRIGTNCFKFKALLELDSQEGACDTQPSDNYRRSAFGSIQNNQLSSGPNCTQVLSRQGPWLVDSEGALEGLPGCMPQFVGGFAPETATRYSGRPII